MKILMLAPQPFFEPRGTPFSVLGRLRALSELGHETDLVTYHVGKDVAIPGVTIHRTPRVAFIKSVKVGPSIPKLFLDLLVFFRAVGLLRRKKYDLLHTHEEASFFGVLLAKLFKVRHLYDMHSSPSQQLNNFQYMGFGPLIRLFEWIEAKVIDSSDAVITICPALEDYVKELNSDVPQMMIENVASEADPEGVTPGALKKFRADHPYLEGKIIILYAGTLEAYQGIDILIRAAVEVTRKYTDALFLVVGGKAAQIEEYQRQVHELGLSSNFRFVGSRPPEDIPSFIRLSHVLVSPRMSGTNTPLKIYSYLQSGKPIVATNLYTHTQALNPDVAQLTDPDADSFARGIIAVLDSPSFADRLGSEARRHFERNYSFSTYMKKTEQILQMTMASAK